VRATLAVLSKELREAFRDANVLLYAVGFPLLLYPLMVWGVVQLLVLEEGLVERQPSRVEVVGSAEVAEAVLVAPIEAGEGGAAALQADRLDLLLEVALNQVGDEVTLSYRSTRPRSERARALVDERLDGLRGERLEALAQEHGLAAGALRSWGILAVDDTPPRELAGEVLGRVIPLLLLTVLVLSTVYPLVEVVAGERERGTLETTMVAAVPRAAVVAGKLLCVVLVALAAVAGNAVAMGATMATLLADIDGELKVMEGLHAGPLLMGLVALLLLAPALAAWLGLTVLPARSFKAGQSNAMLLGSVALALAAVSLVPGLRFSPLLAMVPVTGTSLALRDGFTGQLELLPAALCWASNLAIASAGLWLGARVVGREDFLFGHRMPRWLRWLAARKEG